MCQSLPSGEKDITRVRNITKEEYSVFSINCNAPINESIMWYFNNQTIEDGDIQDSVKEDGRSLTIFNITKQHVGIYKCLLADGDMQTVELIQLHVMCK